MKTNIRRGLAATTALAFGTALAIGGASSASATETWSISSLALTNPVVIDAASTAGDDDGFLAVTKQFVILDGGTAAFSYDLATLADGAATDIPVQSNTSIVTDLKSNISYRVVIDDSDNLTGLVVLDDNGNVTSTTVTLSSPISLTSGGFRALISGFGYVAVWDGLNASLKVIAPDGVVTQSFAQQYFLLSPSPADFSEGSSFFQLAGVGEYDGSNYWYVGYDATGSVYRWNLGGGDSEKILDNVDVHSDADTFQISTCSNKWYSHTENNDGEDDWTSYFGQNITDMEEPLLSADATFSAAGDCPPVSDPELPNTGIDTGAGAALAGLLAGLGAVAFIAVRRRQVASK